MVDKQAFEVKFDAAGVKRKEYKTFKETYPMTVRKPGSGKEIIMDSGRRIAGDGKLWIPPPHKRWAGR